MTITESGRTTMDAYLQALTSRGSFADFLTDDVTLDMVGAGQSAQGRAQVEDFIRYAHEQAFDARAGAQIADRRSRWPAVRHRSRLRRPPHRRVRWHTGNRPQCPRPLQRSLRPHQRRYLGPTFLRSGRRARRRAQVIPRAPDKCPTR